MFRLQASACGGLCCWTSREGKSRDWKEKTPPGLRRRGWNPWVWLVPVTARCRLHLLRVLRRQIPQRVR